jgi:hypothetical protein
MIAGIAANEAARLARQLPFEIARAVLFSDRGEVVGF